MNKPTAIARLRATAANKFDDQGIHRDPMPEDLNRGMSANVQKAILDAKIGVTKFTRVSGHLYGEIPKVWSMSPAQIVDALSAIEAKLKRYGYKIARNKKGLNLTDLSDGKKARYNQVYVGYVPGYDATPVAFQIIKRSGY